MSKEVDLLSYKFIILARGGSRRLPGKNLVDFCGKPMIARQIEVALKFSDEVYVSSDDDRILAAASVFGAKAISRPSSLALDDTTSEVSACHALKEMGHIGNVVLLQPTSPLNKEKYVLEALHLFETKKYDTVISVARVSGVYHSSVSDGLLQTEKKREFYKQNGAIYIVKASSLFAGKTFCHGRIGFVEMPFRHSIDVDTEEDLHLARLIFKDENLA